MTVLRAATAQIKANMAKPTIRKKPALTSWGTVWFMMQPYFLMTMRLSIQPCTGTDPGAAGLWFINRRRHRSDASSKPPTSPPV